MKDSQQGKKKKKRSKKSRQLFAEGLKVPCPECGVKSSQRCLGVQGQPRSHHPGRIKRAWQERDPLLREQRKRSGPVRVSKHDADCIRRRAGDGMAFLCTCGLDDEALERAKQNDDDHDDEKND